MFGGWGKSYCAISYSDKEKETAQEFENYVIETDLTEDFRRADLRVRFFFNCTTAATKSPYLFLTGNAFVGYNDNAETTFDINYPTETPYTDIPVDKWTLVTVTVGLDSGVRIYVNGVNKTPHSVASSTGVTRVKDLPLTDILSTISGIRYFYLGMGSPWGSADCYIDDVMIYNRELPATDVRTLYTMANRVTDFTKGEGGTGIEKVKDDNGTVTITWSKGGNGFIERTAGDDVHTYRLCPINGCIYLFDNFLVMLCDIVLQVNNNKCAMLHINSPCLSIR